MSLAERALAAPTVSLRELLTGRRSLVDGSAALGVVDYAEEIVRSGFPAIRQLPPRARRAQLDGYLARVVERDFAEQGHLVRRPATLSGWLAAYAAATATTSSCNAILDAATPGESNKPAKTTTIVYRDVLSQLWLLDRVPGWSPSRSAFSRLGAAPKHHLADPALAARLLGVDVPALLEDSAPDAPVRRPGPLLGALFESLVTLSVRIYAQAAEATIHHLRTWDSRHEVDIIIQRADQRIVALEVKLSPSVNDADVVHLTWLRRQLGNDLLDVAVITTEAEAYRRADGFAVIPLCLLGP